MQLKMEAMQLKVGMQNNIWEKRINKGYMFTLFLSSFFLLSFTHFFLRIRKKNLSCKQSLILVSRKLLTCLENPFLLRESFLVILISYLTYL